MNAGRPDHKEQVEEAIVSETVVRPEKKFKNAQKRTRPTHFLALQLSHYPETVELLSKIQNAMVKSDCTFSEACVEPCTAHLTLGVLALKDVEEVEAVHSFLHNFVVPAIAHLQGSPLSVQLSGIGHFNSKVLYLQVEENSRLNSLVEEIRSQFLESKESPAPMLDDPKAFAPHVTIAKISNLLWRNGKFNITAPRKFPDSLLGELTDVALGECSTCISIVVDHIQLCCMSKRKPGSYYDVLTRIPLVL